MHQRILMAFVFLFIASPTLAGTNVVVVLDDSSSMTESMRGQRRISKMVAAKKALVTVLENLPGEAHVGVLTLNRGRGDQAWILPLGPIDKSRIATAVQSVRAAGSTPLGHFMKVGADALLKLREQSPYGVFRLLIVTDGEASDRMLVASYLPDILSRGLVVDVIGVDMASNHSLATSVNSYRRADDPESLTRAISEVFAETSADTNDAGESDFQLLAGIPPEMAAAALRALSDSNNQPVGTAPAMTDSNSSSENVRRTVVIPPSGPVGSSGATTFFRLAFGFVCGGFLIMLLAVVGVVFLIRRFA